MSDQEDVGTEYVKSKIEGVLSSLFSLFFLKKEDKNLIRASNLPVIRRYELARQLLRKRTQRFLLDHIAEIPALLLFAVLWILYTFPRWGAAGNWFRADAILIYVVGIITIAILVWIFRHVSENNSTKIESVTTELEASLQQEADEDTAPVATEVAAAKKRARPKLVVALLFLILSTAGLLASKRKRNIQ